MLVRVKLTEDIENGQKSKSLFLTQCKNNDLYISSIKHSFGRREYVVNFNNPIEEILFVLIEQISNVSYLYNIETGKAYYHYTN